MPSIISFILNRFLLPLATQTAKNHGTFDLAYNSYQAWSIKRAEEDPKYFTWIRKYDTWLKAADITSLVISVIATVVYAEKKYGLLNRLSHALSLNPADASVVFFLAQSVATCALAILSTYLINRFYKHSDTPAIDHLSNFSFKRPNSEKLAQQIYVARLITNIVLFALCPSNPAFFLSTALEGYALLKITQRKWVEYSSELSVKLKDLWHVIADKVSIKYSFLLRENPATSKSLSSQESEASPSQGLEACAICLEEGPEAYFCDNHTLHSRCIVDLIASKSKEFGQGLLFDRRNVNETRHYTHGVYTHSSYNATYFLNIPKKNFPTCPLCRQSSEASELEIKVHDSRLGWSPTVISWID